MPHKIAPTFSTELAMVEFKNQGSRTFGEYGEEGYADTVTERVYEEHRFQANRTGRAKAKHEAAMVRSFIDSLPEAQNVLDVPCGMGRFTETILQQGHQATGVDINVGMIQRATARHGEAAQFLRGDIMELPFADNAFDVVICFRLLHHLPDNLILAALTELKRVCSGPALTTFYNTHCFRYQRKKLFRRKISGQYYSPKHIISLCHEAGWQRASHVNPYDIHRNLHGIRLD